MACGMGLLPVTFGLRLVYCLFDLGCLRLYGVCCGLAGD